jgi:AcrR family transcriptional regulator
MKFSEKELQVIDIAERLFAEKGFEGTSVRDIVKEACGNVSMISYYFGSKENLLLAVLERRNNEVIDHITHLIDNKDLTDMQKISIFIDDFLDNLVKRRNLHKVLIREELFSRDPKIYTMIYEFKKKNMAMIEQILQHGKETGEFKKDADIALLMATVIGTTSQLFISQDFYAQISGAANPATGGFNPELFNKLKAHLKGILKLVLTGE